MLSLEDQMLCPVSTSSAGIRLIYRFGVGVSL